MTESYYIHVKLNKEAPINYLQTILSHVIHFSIIRKNTFKWVHEEAVASDVEEVIKPDFLSYYNQLNFDYKGNDCNTPASIFVEFYSKLLNKKSEAFYISGFNSTGAEFMNAFYNKISKALITEVSKAGLHLKIICTFDSTYQTPELFEIAKKLESETGIRSIIT